MVLHSINIILSTGGKSNLDKKIAVCGLDCEKCPARIATINNDDALREKVAKEWSEWNHTEIIKEMINCVGCRLDGAKFPFCDHMCPIRKCAIAKGYETCGDCDNLQSCETIKMIIDANQDALERLIKNK